MPLFEHYVMVDWSGGNARKVGRPDALWLASGARGDREPVIANPASRTEAVELLRSMVAPFAAEPRARSAGAARRVLVGFDFAFGYPRGFASALPSDTRASPAWERVWRTLAARVRDDLGTGEGRRPSNRNNRFEVASALNAAMRAPRGEPGPFWSLHEPGSQPHVPQTRPRQPYALRGGVALESLRETDRRAGSDTPFRLFGTGSVGGQALTGIPCVARLREDGALSRASAVWPFETGWATTTAWPGQAIRIVHAEIYPSVRPALPDSIKDRGQVRAMWRWARDLDASGALVGELARPAGVVEGSRDERAILEEEGWILGCPG